MTDLGLFKSLEVWSGNHDKVSFHKFSSTFEYCVAKAHGPEARTILEAVHKMGATSLDPAEETSGGLKQAIATDMWAALGAKLDSTPWAYRNAMQPDRGLELWRKVLHSAEPRGKEHAVVLKAQLM